MNQSPWQQGLVALLTGTLFITLFFVLGFLGLSVRGLFLYPGILLILIAPILLFDGARTEFTDKRSYLHQVTPRQLRKTRGISSTYYFVYDHWNKKKANTIKTLYRQGTALTSTDGVRLVVVNSYEVPLYEIEGKKRGLIDAAIGFLVGGDCAIALETDGGRMSMEKQRSVSISINHSSFENSGNLIIDQSCNTTISAIENIDDRLAVLRVIEYLEAIDDSSIAETKDLLRDLLDAKDSNVLEKGRANKAKESLRRILESATASSVTEAVKMVIAMLST